ncbi:hypothetical protein M422DRAFT_34283 [Sphaerobolus stellatus SS14]|uniref:Uncharacterized protein n=1 Tax=Sphaerobolus stellatus (strain SS14) TaxID=990650 RepID=A0A0C9VFC6_SPHS4|nr:hypothetical protein M422DRAFT_34283 [Sphaerobolus stellatus SS14]
MRVKRNRYVNVVKETIARCGGIAVKDLEGIWGRLQQRNKKHPHSFIHEKARIHVLWQWERTDSCGMDARQQALKVNI